MLGTCYTLLHASLGMLFGLPLGMLSPQAQRLAIPGISNTLVSLFKDTSVLSVITVAELMKYTGDIISVTFQPFTFYLVAAFIYWGLCLIYEYGIHRRLEARLKKSLPPGFLSAAGCCGEEGESAADAGAGALPSVTTRTFDALQPRPDSVVSRQEVKKQPSGKRLFMPLCSKIS